MAALSVCLPGSCGGGDGGEMCHLLFNCPSDRLITVGCVICIVEQDKTCRHINNIHTDQRKHTHTHLRMLYFKLPLWEAYWHLLHYWPSLPQWPSSFGLSRSSSCKMPLGRIVKYCSYTVLCYHITTTTANRHQCNSAMAQHSGISMHNAHRTYTHIYIYMYNTHLGASNDVWAKMYRWRRG